MPAPEISAPFEEVKEVAQNDGDQDFLKFLLVIGAIFSIFLSFLLSLYYFAEDARYRWHLALLVWGLGAVTISIFESSQAVAAEAGIEGSVAAIWFMLISVIFFFRTLGLLYAFAFRIDKYRNEQREFRERLQYRKEHSTGFIWGYWLLAFGTFIWFTSLATSGILSKLVLVIGYIIVIVGWMFIIVQLLSMAVKGAYHTAKGELEKYDFH